MKNNFRGIKKAFLTVIFTVIFFGIGFGQIISQYVETNSGSTPKGIEIWNNTGSTLDFTTNNLIIQQGTNGGALSDLAGTLINTGTLAAGDVLVIGTSDIGTYLTNQGLTSVTFVSFGFSFNGDDALAVKYGGTITDIFGNPGSDPGSSWDGSGVSTADQNISLLAGVTTGAAAWTDPSARFETTSTNPSGSGGLDWFGIPPTSGPEKPNSFSASPNNSSQIDLSATANTSNNNILVAYNSTNTFGIPNGTYSIGNTITGGGTVHYTGSAASLTNHTGLSVGQTVYYKVWSIDASNDYSVGITDNATTLKPEPTNHASTFTATANGYNQIDLSWLDNDGAQAADGFLIKANTNGSFASTADATDPAEDSDLSDGTALVKIAYGTQSYSFTGLSELTQYYFKIWPYTNSGSDIDFKTDGTVPEDNATTTSIPVAPSVGVVYITEVSDAASNFNAEFIELYNTSDDIIDLSNCKIVMDVNTDFPITNYTGDYQIPAKGFLIIARSATLIDFEAEWSALPANVNYNEGSGGMYIGTPTARRWQLVYNDGSKADIIIDDSQTAVGGDGNTSIQETSGSWTTINVSSATPGELQSGDQQTLPIELIQFTAKSQNDFNLIKWTTASEENNAYFTLEKSYNASDFFEIAEIKGAGNSISELNYQFQDFETSDKTVYYRLKQTDFDGSSSYSEIISIDNNKKDNFSILNSFVTDNQININIKSYQHQSVNLNITNLNGQIVFSKEFKISNGINNLKIDKTKYKNSVYLITIKNQTYLESEKIVLF